MSEIKERPIWLTVHSHPITQTGKLNLKNNIQINLYDFALESFASYIPLIKILDISGNFSIESLEGLPYLPHLHIFNADNTRLSTFKNFKSIRHATKVSFRKTPISKLLNYRLCVLIIIGKKLVSIDGQTISNNLYQKYLQYPEIAKDLVNNGWVAEYPCPTQEELNLLYSELNANDNFDEFSESSSFSQSNNSFNFIDSFQKIVDEYHLRQKQMFEEAEPLFRLPENEIKRNIARKVAISIKQLFFEHGRLLNENDMQGILKAVDDLCQKASLKIKISKSLTEHNLNYNIE